ncbi:dipeptidyl peptidase 9 isoform X1 [Lingula anatina]|uniref:dipeptidyl-peptidase IV n=2 Tax=Lingula anatina TaxID=7574 RepID=A0A1S3IQE8_LINAN|nr:dipeptidyl peptidase 9 isoform X1 [Lingula anatina]|eukprot:XP_013399764.1 dipeptidyl peptidase 9 isoform X1 [Lingula anatina]
MNKMASEVTTQPFEELSTLLPQELSGTKKSWQELRQVVREARKLQTQLINRVPNNFTFRTLHDESGSKTRVYFLGVPEGSRENTLLYIDIDQNTDSGGDLSWKPMLDQFHATPYQGGYSKEEQLLRERKRLGSFGITSFDVDLDCGKFVFPACNSLFTCTDDCFMTKPVFPTELKSCCTGARLDPKICPNNSELIAFINNNDIWVTHQGSGVERRLTFAHKGLSTAEDPKSAGVPSFVVQEEFDRYTGFWWEPKQYSESTNTYRILYEEVDESEVEILHIVSNDEKGVDDYRYPKAGSANAKCSLKIIEFKLDDEGNICDGILEKHMSESLCSLFPWTEYIVRVGWTPTGKYVWAQLLSRRQQQLALVLIPVDCFMEIGCDIEMKCFDGSSLSAVQVIYQETSNTWVNVHDILHFFPEEKSQVSFIWASEKTGHRHLYLVTSKLHHGQENGVERGANGMVDDHSGYLQPCVLSAVALTSGDWEVMGKQIWVDEINQMVYFMGLMDTPLETHLYVVPINAPGSIRRLTEKGHSHAVGLSPASGMFVTVYSSIDMPPCGQLFNIVHDDMSGQITAVSLGSILESPFCRGYKPPEIFSYDSQCGFTMYGMLYKPHNLEPGKKYPTMLFVYGGPQVQLVSNAFKGLRFLRLHTYASMGYAVVVVDGRGSSQRGLAFEGAIKDCMGIVEIQDQVEGLHHIASQVDYIDLNRVAIHGWSYGGYLSLMGLAQRPDVFRVAIAGAPVTTWNLYDTGYTERYIDTPQNNQDGYKDGCVLNYVEKIPSEENRLLIVHGQIDENVHFYHTTMLINALVKACKPYQLQVYPNERHGIRNPEASEHYETLVLSFLQQHL